MSPEHPPQGLHNNVRHREAAIASEFTRHVDDLGKGLHNVQAQFNALGTVARVLQPVTEAGKGCVDQVEALVAAFTDPMALTQRTATSIATTEQAISTQGAGVVLYQATARTGWHSSITAIQPALDNLSTWVTEAHRFYTQTADDLEALADWAELNGTRALDNVRAAGELRDAESAGEIALVASGFKVWLDDIASDAILIGQTWDDRVEAWGGEQSGQPAAHLTLHVTLAACLTQISTTIFTAQVACGAALAHAQSRSQ